MPNTARMALPYPVASDTADVPRDMLALANALDPKAAVFAQGTLASRPAAGTQGRLYYATDTGIVYYDTGSAWVAVGPSAASVNEPVFLGRGAVSINQSTAALLVWMSGVDGGSLGTSASLTVPPAGAFHWDPADYPAAPVGKTAKWRVFGYGFSNSTAPGVPWTVGFRKLTVGGGAGGIIYSMVGSDPDARSATFTITGGYAGQVVDLDVPAAGNYGAFVTWTGTTAASSYAMVFTRLYLAYV